MNKLDKCSHKQLEALFWETFFRRYKTVLKGGAEEPLYQPSEEPGTPHCIYYREDFISSALHEVAHWCLAGEERRQQVDFGYWYMPDGRDNEQQKHFESVEVKPQALEWMFSEAAGHTFNFSADNLNGTGELSDEFKAAVAEQAQRWCRMGLPARGAEFVDALGIYFGTPDALDPLTYELLPGARQQIDDAGFIVSESTVTH